MGRSKVNLKHISDNSARKTSYRKRSACFLKKTSELSTRCDVQACSILYSPDSPTPEVWPSVEGAQEVLARFRNMPAHQQGANKETLESFTNVQIRKHEKKLAEFQKKNFHNDMTHRMYKKMRGESTSKASLEDLQKMGKISDQKMREIAKRIEEIKLGGNVNASQGGNGKGLVGGSTANHNNP